MSGSVSDMNSSSGRSVSKGAAQKFPGEADIFRVIYPGGLIPVERMDSIPAMRSHINALLALASGQVRPRKLLEAGEAQALNEKIAYLKETPKEDGTTRSWPEISRILNAGFNGESCRRRYKAWKQQRRPRQTDRAALRSAAEQEDTTASEAVAPLAILEHSSEKAQQEFEQVVRPATALQEGPEPDENQAIPENNETEESKVPANKWDPGNGRGPLPESTKEEILKRYDNHLDAKEISSSMGLDGRRVQGVITGSRLSKRKVKGAESAADETLRNVPVASGEVQQKPEPDPCRQELQEAKPAQSHDVPDLEPKAPQNSKQVSSAAAARAPKIPHSEDDFILKERAGGKKFREIHEALQARGIKCELDDVIWRHNSLLKNVKDGIEAESKAPELQQSQAEPAPATEPTMPAPPGFSPEDLEWILDLAEIGWSAEEISQELMQSGVSLNPEQVAEILAGKKKKEKKPEPKHFRKGELDAVIWKMHTKEKLSPEEISARLQEDGYSYEAGTIRTRLRAQGAKL